MSNTTTTLTQRLDAAADLQRKVRMSNTTTTTTRNRSELLDELITLQNTDDHAHHDIVTITGFMTDAQLKAHLETHSL